MTGAYLRVKRNGKWENIEIEHMTDEERQEHFKSRDVIPWLNLVCEYLSRLEP